MTLGVIAAYVVIIAILWNIPYVRYVLWPFKVSLKGWTNITSTSWRRLTWRRRC